MGELNIESIRITAQGCNVDFEQARRLAEEVIADMVRVPRLIAWTDAKKGIKHPALHNEQTNMALIDYAKVHNGRVRVDVNEQEYSFIFSES